MFTKRRKIKIITAIASIISLLSLVSYFLFSSTAYSGEDNDDLVYFGCDVTTTAKLKVKDNSGTEVEIEPKTWATYLSQIYGKKARDQVENFAVRGASTADLTKQRNTYYATNPKVTDNTVYLTYIGPNDFTSDAYSYAQVSDTKVQKHYPEIGPQVHAFLDQRTSNMVNHIEDLIAHGATHIIILSYPNENYRYPSGLTLHPHERPYKSMYNYCAYKWNEILAKKIEALKEKHRVKGVNIILLDYFRFTTAMGVHVRENFNSGAYNAYYGGGSSYYPSELGHKRTAKWVSELDKHYGWNENHAFNDNGKKVINTY